jgi:hypothetical protein
MARIIHRVITMENGMTNGERESNGILWSGGGSGVGTWTRGT